MASPIEVLGLTHMTVTSVLQIVSALKQQLNSYRTCYTLLEEAGIMASRIKNAIDSLSSLARVTDLDSVFFNQTLKDFKEVQDDLMAIQHQIRGKSTLTSFLKSSKIVSRLESITKKLCYLDQALHVVGMISDLVASKVSQECTNLRGEISNMNVSLNSVLSSNFSVPIAKTTLDILRSGHEPYSHARSLNRPSSDILASEHKANVFFSLGRSYYEGDSDFKIDHGRAARYFLGAFENGSKSSAYYLGKLYDAGEGVEQCFYTAYSYYSIGAENGDARAMMEMGWCYDFGHGCDFNGNRAVEWYNKSARAGSGAGMWMSGYHALHGNASRRNWRKAFKFLRQARSAGEFRANMDLAHCFENGIYVTRNPRMAYALLKEAYDAGGSLAPHHLARCYEFGIGVPKDMTRAANLYKELADSDSWLGRFYQVYYGLCLVRGLGVPKKVRTGLHVIKEGLSAGHACAWSVYGDCFRHGYGVKRDVIQAVRCYSKAISSTSGQRGIVDAHFALAEMFETGDGLAKDLEKAVHHYLGAANRMNRNAQWKVALFFEKGSGVDAHIHRAFYYFDLSARSGHYPAQLKAAELYMKGMGVQRDRNRAIDLLKQAVDQGNPDAERALKRYKFFGFCLWRRRRSA